MTEFREIRFLDRSVRIKDELIWFSRKNDHDDWQWDQDDHTLDGPTWVKPDFVPLRLYVKNDVLYICSGDTTGMIDGDVADKETTFKVHTVHRIHGAVSHETIRVNGTRPKDLQKRQSP